MKSGTKPTKIDHRDFDLHASFGTVVVPFPTEYFTDAGLWMPNQETENITKTFTVKPELFGCTNFTQADVSADEKGVLNDPSLLEAITHANENGGGDIRASLTACLPPTPFHPERLGWITGFFTVLPHQLDWFDSMRLAMISGIPEKRSLSVGTPWYPMFETVGSTGILQMPPNLKDPQMTWHNHKFCGWKVINGETFLISKSWQGNMYGDKGFCYWRRSLVNLIMSVDGTGAFTTTQGVLPPISTVPVTLFQWLMSHLTSLRLAYGI